MIHFLFKGLIRDRARSRIPVAVVAVGVMLSVFMHSYITGLMGDMIELTARFSAGHLKITTRSYAENQNQFPNDLAILESTAVVNELNKDFPNVEWMERIRFGGLIDVADSSGETRAQGPAMGMGIDLLSEHTSEPSRLRLSGSLVTGRLPSEKGEILISDDFARKLDVMPGNEVTLIGSTMNGGMAIYNFVVSGTLRFGTTALDRGTVIADLQDVRDALEMQNASGEINGYLKQGFYDDETAQQIVSVFNSRYSGNQDEFGPVMTSLKDQQGMDLYIFLADKMGAIITAVFMLAMSLVLWNAGLLGGLRRYGEIGVRLAIGEEKGHVYKTLIYESVMIGIAGTLIGTFAGLFFAALMQKYGLNIGTFTKGASASIMMPDVIRARITPADYYIGFIPGVISTVIGTALAGIGIYKRKTSQLFKELEV